jgi:hypothetical protein
MVTEATPGSYLREVRTMKKYLAVTAVLALVAVGAIGALSSAHASTSAAPAEKTTAVDADNVQSGDQTSPDALTAASTSTAPSASAASESQQSESESATEPAGETSDSSLPGGGHQDTAGANVDHQFQGVE